MAKVLIDICDGNGWRRHSVTASSEKIAECYRLPKERCRAEFFGLNVPSYRALIWQIDASE